MKKFFCILIVIFCINGLYSQEQEPRPTAVIIQELKDSYTAQQAYIEDLKNISNNKDVTITELQEKVAFTAERLDEAIEDDAKKTAELIKKDAKIKLLVKWLVALSIIFGLFTILHFVILILKLKWNISLPYWLNTIL